jgi:glycosyltransferase involved in cell wall biosynthesis
MKELIHYFDLSNSKIAIIYCGVDQSVFYPRNDKQIEVVKQKYSIPNRPYVLYLGNIEPRKNLKRLVKAFDDLKVGIKNKYALVIIGGDGWLNEDTYDEIDRARKNGSVIYKPNRYVSDEDIPALISGASLLAHPALYEGFGLSPLQAMSCGIPVVVGNNSSFPEVVGSAGLFVDVEDESDISAKMEAALTDGSLHKTLSKKGLLQAKKFTWERSAQAIITCLKEA